MNNRNRKPLIGLIALSAALAMPMAFAQDATTEDAAQPQAEQTQPTPTESAESATGATSQPAEQATSAASSGKQGWDDVDIDKDGAISKQEASSNAGLSQVFDQADGNADGKLTADEYKAFVSKNYGDPKTK
jgi:cytochrome c peroxidase